MLSGPAFHFICSCGAGGFQRRGTVEAVAMQVFESSFGRNVNADEISCRSGGVFARVHFAWTTYASRGDFSNPRVALSKGRVWHESDVVQTGHY